MTTEDSGIPAATAEDHPGPSETAEANTPTIEPPSEDGPPAINWPAWLEEYYQADQADRITGRRADLPASDKETNPEFAKLKRAPSRRCSPY